MTQNPYKVLGVPETASAEEIKKAYRRKSKECHPDIHPDDPDASRKMNEVNQAYSILTNPDKLDAWKRENSGNAGRQNSGSGAYGYGQSGSYQNTQSGYGRAYQGGGYTSWGTGEDWETIFDIFGMGQVNVDTTPRAMSGDSSSIILAINFINNRKYNDALRQLINIPSYERNARWYYLSAMANRGMGNDNRALEHIRKAVQLDSNNKVYRTLYRKYSGGRSYYTQDTSAANSSDTGHYSGQGSSSYSGGYRGRRRGGVMSSLLRFGFTLLIIDMIFKFFMMFSYHGMWMLR